MQTRHQVCRANYMLPPHILTHTRSCRAHHVLPYVHITFSLTCTSSHLVTPGLRDVHTISTAHTRAAWWSHHHTCSHSRCMVCTPSHLLTPALHGGHTITPAHTRTAWWSHHHTCSHPACPPSHQISPGHTAYLVPHGHSWSHLIPPGHSRFASAGTSSQGRA